MRLLTLPLPLALVLPLFPTRTNARPWKPGDECPETIKKVISSDRCEYYGGDYCTDKPAYDNMNNLHTVLLNCPNITGLDLRVTGLGCSNWPSRWTFPFNPAGGETYPRLKTLRLEGYGQPKSMREPWHFPQSSWAFWESGMDISKWVWSGNYKTWLEWRALPPEQKYKSNFALWLDAMDWSGIEEFWTDRWTDEVVEKLPSRLTSLHTLESINLTFIEKLPNNTLKNFTWIGPSKLDDLPAILSHQGNLLQSLEFRCPEIQCRFSQGFNISILPNATKNLTHLSINVPRNGTWPLETLETIASLPNLRTANLYFEIRSQCQRQMPPPGLYLSKALDSNGKVPTDYCMGENKFQKPFLDSTSALDLAEYMKEKNQGGRLDKVTFWVGDWTRSWDGPVYTRSWLEGKRAKIECNIGSSDIDHRGCSVEEGEKYWKWKESWMMDDEWLENY